MSRESARRTNRPAMLIAALVAASSMPVPRGRAADGEPAAPPPASLAAGLVYSLDQFGGVAGGAAVQATYEKAWREIVAAGGGVLLIPAAADKGWKPSVIPQEHWRSPEPPAPAKTWGVGPGVTVIDCRGGTVSLSPPQATGLQLSRTLQLPEGQSLPHWNYNPMIKMDNTITRGSTSYRDWLQEDVAKGQDRRFYVPTIRGIFPGMFINAGDYGQIQRLHVKSLGHDPEKKLWYFVADTDADIKKGTLVHNKNHVNVMRMDTYSHNENQTFDLMLWRHNYSQGDNYLVDARFNYMGDVHSTAGDENGVLFAGFIHGESNIFRGTVASWDASRAALVFKDARNNATLGSGRPIINLNPAKWITAGTAWIVRPASWIEPDGPALKSPVFRGRSYPTAIGPDRLGNNGLRMGGLIRLSADAPVTPEAAGRYFAVDEPTEQVPGADKVRRWYLIDAVTVNDDGTKDLRIVRHWWGAKSAGSPTLYHPDNYSRDGHEKPLTYVIAPGANAYDVSDGLPAAGNLRTLRLSPAPFAGTAADFAAGDGIEQAIGPDPFHPIPFRSWTWDVVPGVFPAPVFDIANHGKIQRHTVLSIRGGDGDLEKDRRDRHDHETVYDRAISIGATCNDGIVFSGDVANAAIAFDQPHDRPQPIQWRYDGGARTASLTVSPRDGVMRFEGGGVAVPGGLAAVGGLSGTDVAAHNLRGIGVPVKAGVRELAVTFPRAEADADFAVFAETSWVTARGVTRQTAEGFVVQFEKPPPTDGTVHWLIVR